MPRPKKTSTPRQAEPYKHPEAESPMRPEVGTQAQFRKKKAPKTYRYDSSLSPALDWDGGNAKAREQGEAHIQKVRENLAQASMRLGILGEDESIGPEAKELLRGTLKDLAEAQSATGSLKAMSQPFLNWAGKAERLSFDVPTLPLFVHERLSTKAIIETLKGHKKQASLLDLFADPQHPVADQVLRAYEHRDKWVNRMVLGDSLVVMNSLLHYEVSSVRRRGTVLLQGEAREGRGRLSICIKQADEKGLYYLRGA